MSRGRFLCGFGTISIMDAALHYLLLGILASLGLLVLLRAKRKRGRCRYWVRPWLKRRDEPTQRTMLHLYREFLVDGDVAEFRSTLRMNPDVYMALLNVLRSSLTNKHTNYRTPISPEIRLAATLRYLALGDCFRSISQQFRIGLSTTRLIVRETCKIIVKTLQHRHMATPRTQQEWTDISNGFATKWEFPHCLGCIDGKHIRIAQPLNSGTYYFNYKGYFSTVLLAIANADYKFLYVSVGAEGRASDGGIWSQCSFKEYLTDPRNPLNIPDSDYIQAVSKPVPYFLLGDDAFKLSPYLMKRFPGGGLSRREKIFNYRLSRGRRVIENAFGILSCRFRIFRRCLEVQPDFVDDLVLACCVLHNYLADNAKQDYMPATSLDTEMPDGDVQPGIWRQEPGLDPMVKDKQKNATEFAKDIRYTLSKYFLTAVGEIPWQYKQSMEL